jgi:hypothetical protein
MSVVCALAFVAACSRADDGERTIGAPQRVEARPNEARLFASSAERFGTQMPGATAVAAKFEYALPDDWAERPATDMRAVNLAAGASGATECYVTVLGGDGGGALANINRWCGQIGAKPWTEADLAAAPTIAMFGSDAVIAAVGGEAQERMLIGALARLDSRSVFVKLIGPRAEVLAQRGAFEAFCKSLARKR